MSKDPHKYHRYELTDPLPDNWWIGIYESEEAATRALKSKKSFNPDDFPNKPVDGVYESNALLKRVKDKAP